jgi:hypothetical protein
MGADDPDGRATHHGVGPADPKINLAFDPAEMKRYFPAEAVAWMSDHRTVPHLGAPLVGLPAAIDLPIVVTARMSPAFPFLLSAVKLYEVDGGSVETGRAGTRECWFTDGCLTSNFPIKLFDSPLPRWPTFAINLGNVPANSLSPDESQNVWMPQDDHAMRTLSTPVGPLTSFLSSMIGAIKDWNDNTQARVPGFRDRIVTVMLDPREGAST